MFLRNGDYAAPAMRRRRELRKIAEKEQYRELSAPFCRLFKPYGRANPQISGIFAFSFDTGDFFSIIICVHGIPGNWRDSKAVMQRIANSYSSVRL